ncbi:MAG TPA: glycosyltransferase, partial [Tepidisphaeraceae bacterium]|nr:glycosyltransferase [Tepidisphaeraceae bacterium]
FEQNGWIIADAFEASRDPSAYQSWIQDSLGEFTVIKSLYAAEPSGWFSDRSACFLATGRPVITQSSGFEKWIETGEGLFTFSNLDEAARAVQSVIRDAEKHARAARALAEKHFDAKVVLRELLRQVE